MRPLRGFHADASSNTFNTPAFGVPGSNLGSGGFGIAGAGASDREMQFALKLYY